MKLFVVSIVLAVIVATANADLTDAQKENVKKYGKECIAESGVDKEVVVNAKKGQFADDPKLTAFTFCMSKKIGFQNEAGDLQESVIKEKLTGAVGANAADALMKKCLIKKDTPEATALEVFKCYYANTPEHQSLA